MNKESNTVESSNAINKMLPAALWKDGRHNHFWIEDEQLFESYRTIRGLRYRYRMDVPGMPDSDNCSNEELKYIEDTYLS